MKEAKQTPPPPSPTADQDGAGDDRLNALDDDLCELILRLAHLNVRELVHTSVLSKRWRGLWKRLPVLDFFGWPEFKSAGEVQQYIAIVNDVLEQRAGATSEARINEVKIPLLMDAYSLHGLQPLRLWPAAAAAAARATAEQLLTPAMEAAEAWIRYAMHHQVKGFQFNLRLVPLDNKTPVMDLDELLPSSPKLESMRLGLSSANVRLPRTAVFTSLKDLTLEFVELAAGSGHRLARLLSSVCCPSLQKLRMMCIDLLRAGTKKLVLDTGELLELSMEVVEGMELLELRTPKLLYLEIDECYHESLRVSAPRLEDLTYVCNRAFIHDPLLGML
ncbi:FBD-associated F-box protein At5g38590-like [Miscanthus floridulus]|uniref:FBD-associated F-box protein At5g38590-like n=1 Tax=Miscanthus floridulus TaxID=154761 RepID=UPI003458B9AD